jgi:hypothetical protein
MHIDNPTLVWLKECTLKYFHITVGQVKTKINWQLKFSHHRWAEVKTSINEQYDI